MDGTAALGKRRDQAPLQSLLRASLLQILSENVHGAGKGDSPRRSRPLRIVRDAVLDNDVGTAMRNMDRAWRCPPEDTETLAPIYGRLLMLAASDDNAALQLLLRAAALAPHPDVAALIVVALLRMERHEDARRQLEESLGAYCVTPGGMLFHVAGEVMAHPAIHAPGWIGRRENLEFIGQLAPDEPANALDLRLEGQAIPPQFLPTDGRSEDRSFTLVPPRSDVDAGIDATSRGRLLLGSGSRIPSNFALDGRTGCTGRYLKGWVRMGWLPSHPMRLRLEDEAGQQRTLECRRARRGDRWDFDIDLSSTRLSGGRIVISAQVPDQRWCPLPDSPLLLGRTMRLPGRKPSRLVSWAGGSIGRRRPDAGVHRASLIDVIIPVYRGRDETMACIDAVLDTIDDQARVVVVDDAGNDPELVAALDAMHAGGRISLLRNAVNEGFVASVNRALALNPTHDAVLLNSDTRVYAGWLQRLQDAAYSGPAIGTVTPLSNNGSIASYPRAAGAAIESEDGVALNQLVLSTQPGLRVEIPVGVGFCLYMRRDCLQDVGSLDAAVFGKGYGEEADFCLRARRLGWSHWLAADVFVYHAGGRSFGGRRIALLERSRRLLNLRHPGYDNFIATFLAHDPIQAVRRGLDERRLLAFGGRFVLLVTPALTGGVERFVADRGRSLREQGLFPLVLRTVAGDSVGRCELWTDAMELPNLRYDIPGELGALSALLAALRLDATEIQHFLHLDARLIDAVRALPVPYDVVIHDYAWICPRVTLIDGTGRYCGEPAVAVCEVCVRRNGSHLGESMSVAALRARSATWLRAARRVIAPSADTATRLQRYFPGLILEVQANSAPPFGPPSPSPRSPRGAVVRVAVIGAVGSHKGYRVLLDCARNAQERGLALEFVVIGYTEGDAPLLEIGNVFITGRYSEGEVSHLLQRERPDVAWLPSVWPETWCYTLDHALRAGLPVAAFDLGAIAERLREVDQGELMPLGLEPQHINDRLLELAAAADLRSATASRSEQTPLSPPHDDLNNDPSHSGKHQMSEPFAEKPTDLVQLSAVSRAEGLSASVQVLPLQPGLYLFSVKATNSPSVPSEGLLSLPALHVGLGPGVGSAQVEFLSAPSTHGAWLFAATDMLVTRVNGTGATLVLTSVRAPGGELLSIKVESLSARVNAPGPEMPRVANSQADKPVFGSATGDLPLPVQIGAHIRTRGDMSFIGVPWAGRVAAGLWIESFCIRPLEQIGPHEIEYKGLTGSGFETPWLSDDKMCGTKGMATPLVGFALRFKPGPATASYNCEYSGYFQSGQTVGPLRNGAPCRSSVANDPLEGIQLRLVKRPSITGPTMHAAPTDGHPP